MSDFCLGGWNPICWLGAILGGGCASSSSQVGGMRIEWPDGTTTMTDIHYQGDDVYTFSTTGWCDSDEYVKERVNAVLEAICEGNDYELSAEGQRAMTCVDNAYRFHNISVQCE